MDRFFTISSLICILGAAGLVFIQVIFRYLLKSPVILFEELLMYPTIWLYFIGCAAAAKEGSQITANIVATFIDNKKVLAYIEIIAMLISVVVSAWLTYWGYDYMIYSLNLWKTSASSYIPLFYAEISAFFGFAMITFYTALWFFKKCRAVYRGEFESADVQS